MERFKNVRGIKGGFFSLELRIINMGRSKERKNSIKEL
jgi:hypothetical protein